MKRESRDNVFATNLRKVMKESKVTHEALAKVVEVTRAAIGQYCDGSSEPKFDKLRKIADYFKVSIDYLLGLIDTPSTNPKIKEIHDFLGLSEKAIKALRESRLTYNKKAAERVEAKLIEELKEFETKLEYHSLQDLLKGLKTPQKIERYKAATNTIPCIEILLRQQANDERLRVIDYLLDYFNFEEQDFVTQALYPIPDFVTGKERKADMITGEQMTFVLLSRIQNALIGLKKELKSEGNK